MSTGATYLGEIRKSFEILKNQKKFSLLHCVTIYPTPLNKININKIRYLQKNLKSQSVFLIIHHHLITTKI